MPTLTFLPDPDHLELLCLQPERQTITAVVRTRSTGAHCPQCGHCSERVQSRYVRHPADLPWQGVAMRLELHVRHLFCDLPDCPQAIFAERLPDVLAPYAPAPTDLRSGSRRSGLPKEVRLALDYSLRLG